MTITEATIAQVGNHSWFDPNHATVILPFVPTDDDDPLLEDHTYLLYATKRPGEVYPSPAKVSTPKWDASSKLPYPLKYIARIGQTGWDCVNKLTRYVCFEFDHEDGHGKGLATGEINAIAESLCWLGYVEVRQSTSGRGLHVRIRLATPIPTTSEAEYSAVQQAVYRQLCEQVPAIAGKIDKVALGRGNLWLWANIGTADEVRLAAFDLISPAVSTLPVELTPAEPRQPVAVQGDNPVEAFLGRHDLALGTKELANGVTGYYIKCACNHRNKSADKTMVWYEDGQEHYRCFSDSCDVEDFIDYALRVAPGDEVYKKYVDHGGNGLEYANSLMPSLEEQLTSPVLNFLKPSAMQQTFDREWLINAVMVQYSMMLIGAPEKAYKTIVAAYVAASFALGIPFLGHFDVPKRRRTYFLAGENDPAETESILRHIARLHDCSIADMDEYLTIGSWLPSLDAREHLAKIKRCFRILKPEVFILDSLYRAVNADVQGNDAAFARLLHPILEICNEVGCTPIILAHTIRSVGRSKKMPTLYDMAGAGISKMAGQWILTNHRKDWRDGFAQLNLVVGGRAGQRGEYELDINDDPFTVVVRDRKVAQQERSEAKLSQLESVVANYLGTCENGETKKQIIDNCKGIHNRNIDEILGALIQRGLVEICDVVKPTGTYPGYRLVQPASRRAG